MKKIAYLKFIMILIIILGIYYFSITHIDYFITDFDKMVMSYENTYNTKISETNIIEKIVDNSLAEKIDSNTMNEILNSSFYINLISKLFYWNEEETTNYLKEYFNLEYENIFVSPYYSSKIVVLEEAYYVLVFTLDGENIYYNNYDSYYCNYDKGDTAMIIKDNQDIEIISKNIKQKFTEIMGTKIELEITSIRQLLTENNINSYYSEKEYLEYNENINNIYYIEDSKHNIKITYDAKCNMIYNLQIGFEELSY